MPEYDKVCTYTRKYESQKTCILAYLAGWGFSQRPFTCSKLITETLKQDVKYAPS